MHWSHGRGYGTVHCGMGRILKAYETRFRWLLRHARARRLDQGVAALIHKARQLSATGQISLADGLARVHEELALRSQFRPANASSAPVIFYCDAGLGGLARWLRAAGYEAFWEAGIDDNELLRRARTLAATILTTDSMLMERRVLRDQLIPSLWLPPTLGISEQLRLVFGEFDLQLRAPRCMHCGGELRGVDKAELRDRVPPRTYRWLNEYFVCNRCGQVFWHGTHWTKIVKELEALKGAKSKAISWR